MKKQYDNYILNNIMKHNKYEPFNVISQLEDYMRNYPKDYGGYVAYAKMLIDVGDFDTALQVLDFIEDVFPNARVSDVKYFRVRLYMLTGKYEEAKKIFDKYRTLIIKSDPNVELFEIVYKTRTNNNLKRDDSNRYIVNQYIEYSYEDFLSHIVKHTADSNMKLEQPNATIFAPDFPLEQVLEEIKKYIPGDRRMFFYYFNDFYVFKYDTAGRINNKSVDYFRVIAIHDTQDCITMYPLDTGENLPYIDLNYLKEEKEDVKVKKLSRVDKFNQKYGSFIK